MDIVEEKKLVRKKIKELKKQISLEEKIRKSEAVIENLEKNVFFKNAKIVMIYWSMDDEVHTHSFIEKWAGLKKILLPSVDGDQLLIKEYINRNNMVDGERFAILEPDGEIFNAPELIDLIIVPGVAFDKQNNRLGRGKAYYDKLLRTFSVKKIGICFNFQLFDNIPVDQYDMKMDAVISD